MSVVVVTTSCLEPVGLVFVTVFDVSCGSLENGIIVGFVSSVCKYTKGSLVNGVPETTGGFIQTTLPEFDVKQRFICPFSFVVLANTLPSTIAAG